MPDETSIGSFLQEQKVIKQSPTQDGCKAALSSGSTNEIK